MDTFDPTTLRALCFYREQLVKEQERWVEWCETWSVLQYEIDNVDKRLSPPITLRLAS